MSTPEQHHGSAERTKELERAAAERAAEIQKSPEHGGEQLHKQAELAQEARAEAERQALPTEQLQHEEQVVEENTSALAKSRTPEKAFEETMDVIQRQMSGPSRVFSKVIHNKVIEDVSEVTGSTIARPNAILSGSVCALLLVVGLYAHAKYIGYSLSGFETIGAFLLGWSIGLAFDFIRMFLRKR